jgi:predicted MFS family arabinose efflux permease
MLQEDNKTAINKYAWVILAVVYLASFAGNLLLNKVAPLVVNLTDEFGVSLSQVGLMMSMLGLTGLVLALPAGVILQRQGLRITGTVALAFFAVGAALGALSGSFYLLLFSRLLEGIGFTLMVVLSPAAIAMWFPQRKIGTPMGIWTTAGPLGTIVIVMLAPLMALSIGWRGVWWVSAAIAVVALVVFWLFMRPPPRLAEANQADDPGGPLPDAPPGWKKALRNRDIWLLGLASLIFSLLFTPFLTYYVTFLASDRDYSLSRAGLIFGLTALSTIPAAPLSGWVSDLLGTRKWVAVAAFLLLAPLYVVIYQLSGIMIIVALVLLGIVAISIPVSIFAAVADVMGDIRLVGIGVAVLIVGQNLGLIIGAPIFGGLVESTSWLTAAYAFAPLCLLGALVLFLTKSMR